jgi:hypothetical protein
VGWVDYTFESTLRKQERPVTALRQPAPRRETRIWVAAADIPDSATALSHFSNGYLMIGDDPTIYRYESFLSHPQVDVVGLQISPALNRDFDITTNVYAIELGLLSNAVRDVAVGPDGRMWFASRPDRIPTDLYGGVSVLDVEAGTWQHYTVRNTAHRGQAVGQVIARVEARETRVPANFGSEAAANAALPSGFVMFEGDPTIYRYLAYDGSDNALTVYPIFNTLKYPAGVQQPLFAGTQIYAVELGLLGTPEGDEWADRLAVDRAGRMWIAMRDVGISVLDSLGEWTNYQRSDDGLADVQIVGILPRGDEMWVWTDGGGVSVFRNGVWRSYDVFNSGLADDEIESLTINMNGEVWMATHDSGISVLTLPGFRLDLGTRIVLATPGDTAKVYFDVVPVAGFNDNVVFSSEGLPPGVESTFVPGSVNSRGSTMLTLQVSNLVAPGSYPFTIVGRSPDGLTTTRRLTLHVVSSLFRAHLPLFAR